MSPIRKLQIFSIAFVMAASIAFASPASADEPDLVDCDIPSSVWCKVVHTDGIKRVYVEAELGNLFDETFDDCPISVPIAFDAITPNFQIVVEPCESKDFAPADPDDRRPDGVELKPESRHGSETVDPWTEYCIKKYAHPDDVVECIHGFVVD